MDESVIDYTKYIAAPSDVTFERATTEQRDALLIINENNRAAGIIAMIMFFVTGIAAIVAGYTFLGIPGAIGATVLGVATIFIVALSIRKRTVRYCDFEIARAKIVSKERVDRGNYRYSCNLWIEDQQKYVTGIGAGDRNGIRDGAEVYFIKAFREGEGAAKLEEYIIVTDYDYKIMKMNVEARENA